MSDLSRFELPWHRDWWSEVVPQLSASALIVHGEPGWGQLEFLVQVAQAWLCEDMPRAAGGAPTRSACGHCAACKLFAAGTHPDFKLVVPEVLQAQLGWQSDDAETDGSDRKRKPSQDIKVEAIRDIVGFSQRTVSRSAAKVVVLFPAERLNTVSANTLLKTLEEPPGDLRFLIGTGSLADVLPTVRSRCQAWRPSAPRTDLVQTWLGEMAKGLSVDDATVLLAACGQRPLLARTLVEAGWSAAAWRQLPAQLLSGQGGAWAGWTLPLLLDALQKLCTDLARVAAGAPARFFPQDALPALPEGRDTLEGLTAWGQELRRQRLHIEHPWNAPLKAESLIFQARKSLSSITSRRKTG